MKISFPLHVSKNTDAFITDSTYRNDIYSIVFINCISSHTLSWFLLCHLVDVDAWALAPLTQPQHQGTLNHPVMFSSSRPLHLMFLWTLFWLAIWRWAPLYFTLWHILICWAGCCRGCQKGTRACSVHCRSSVPRWFSPETTAPWPTTKNPGRWTAVPAGLPVFRSRPKRACSLRRRSRCSTESAWS